MRTASDTSSAEVGKSADDDDAAIGHDDGTDAATAADIADDADAAAAEDDSDDADAAATTDTEGTRRRWVRWLVRSAATVLVVAALAGAGYQSWLLFAQHQRDVAARQALDAAKHFADAFTNADPTTIDQKIDEVSNGTTGEFREKYVKNISQLRAMLIENKVTTRGSVVDSAVKSASTDSVDVLLLVKQSFTGAATPEAPGDQSTDTPSEVVAMAITVQKVDGHWLVSKVIPGDKL